MNPFEMVVAIVFIGCITAIVRGRQAQRSNTESIEGLEEKLARLEDLDRRVQVLEKIVTDGKYDLKREFADLERS